jgi:N-acetylglutamate synthase-like GNAT family acetyltransferase
MDPELEALHNAEEEFDYNSIILRRADPDDCDQIINLVEMGKDDVYNRVYSYPRTLKLIESAFLAITVLDRDGNVVAFAAFEDYPPVSAFLFY